MTRQQAKPIDDSRIDSGGIVACYIRLTRRESFRGDSERVMRLRFEEEVPKHPEWGRTEVFAEPKHVSGELGETRRPELHRLMNLARSGKVNTIVVRELARLGRGTVLLHILDELRDLGVRLRTFHGPVDYESATGQLQVEIQAAVNKHEARITGERVRENRRRRLMEGYWPSQAPFGFTSQARFRMQQFNLHEDGDLAREEAQATGMRPMVLYHDDGEVGVVDLIYDLVEKGWGNAKIARHLNARGDTYRNGSRWRAQYVRRVVRSPVMAGRTHFDDDSYDRHRKSRKPPHLQRFYEGKHDPIIDPERWDRIQKLVDARRPAFQRGGKGRTYPLTGCTFDVAGHRMRGQSSGAGGPHYYACSHRSRGLSDCSSPRPRADELDAAVRKVLTSLFDDPETLARLSEKVNAKLMADAPRRRDRVAGLRAKIAKVTDDRARALRRSAEAVDDDLAATYAQAALRLRRDREELQQELAVAEAQVVPTLVRSLDADQVGQHLGALLDGLDEDLDSFASIVDRLREHHDLRITVLDRHNARVEMNMDPSLLRGTGQKKLRVLGPEDEPRLPLLVDVQVGEPYPLTEGSGLPQVRW